MENAVPARRRLTKVRIFLADDHVIFSEALRISLAQTGHFEIVGTASDGREALEQIGQLKPEIAVLDISMPGLDGIELTRQIVRYYKETRVILLSSYDDDQYVKSAVNAGVKGYVLKTAAHQSLVDAVDAVTRGEFYLSPQITSKLVGGFSHSAKSLEAGIQTRFDVLSDREREILRLITEGKSQRDIASLLFLSEATVKSHRHNIMKKLDIHKSVDLVKQALKSGLIKM
jgi:DNA-binding NarL/FixJ family response regulator